MKEHFDTNSIITIAITFILFILAVFTKGLTHDLFLEAGVFLVSVKLILMAYKGNVHAIQIEEQLKEIKEKFDVAASHRWI